MSIKAPTGTYRVCSRIHDEEVLSRLNHAEEKALKLLSAPKPTGWTPKHVALTPSFKASCLDVVSIASACSFATKIKNHPITLIPFMLGDMRLAITENEVILYFELIIHREGNLQILSYISALNSRVRTLAQFMVLQEEPKTLTLQIEILRTSRYKPIEPLTRLTRSESKKRSSLFYLSLPELYIKTAESG